MMYCSVENCGSTKRAKGLCAKHYIAKKRECPEYRAIEVARAKSWKQRNAVIDSKHQALYRERHKQHLKDYFQKWLNENRASYNAYQATRKRRVRTATPPWADLDAIRSFYLNCPVGYHVDHIVPINGRNVCGLHVLENLQYLPAIENLRKSNKVE